ncbi:MAG: hypothetical protein VKO39_04680 [Cyanobacteriota bacterium]|nr:hypothetical protein [Cyanobacteriota bacterium]
MRDTLMDMQFGQPSHPGELPSLPAPAVSTMSEEIEFAIKLSDSLVLFSRVVLIIFFVSILVASFPVQPSNPLWYLRLGQIAADYSVTLIFSLSLLLLADWFGSWGFQAKSQKNLVQRLIVLSLIAYAFLVPIQLLTYGLHWQQTAELSLRANRQAESEAANLVDRIRSVKSEEQFRRLLGQTNMMIPSPPDMQWLEQKNKLIEAINRRPFDLRSRLRNDRQQRLSSLALKTTKGVVVAAAMVVILFRVQRLMF